MKKYIALFLTALIIFAALNGFAANEGEESEFEEDSVLAVLKTENGISLFSSDPFEGLGIAKTENLDAAPGGVSLLAETGGEVTLKLTLEKPGKENVLETVEKLRRMPQIIFTGFPIIRMIRTSYQEISTHLIRRGRQRLGIWDLTVLMSRLPW